MPEEQQLVIRNMRERVDRCRRLAKGLTDDRARDALLKMAQEIEADIKRLEATRS